MKPEHRGTILIADDEPNLRRTLSSTLKLEGFTAVAAANGEEAVQIARGGRPLDAVILDLQMPVLDGLSALKILRQERPDLPVLILTAHGSVEKAVEAVREGAFDFLEKPPSTDRLLVALSNALRLSDLQRENAVLRGEWRSHLTMVGESPLMETLAGQIDLIAPTESRVLILGENGSGKELVAQAIHNGSARSGKPFVRVNCAAIPEGLFESELFGHEKGAFTGATKSRSGKFEQAHTGTLFLDEIGEVPLNLQPKLLRAIESNEVERVGGDGTRVVDVRLLAATNRNLESMVKEGLFREDLYYRLNVLPISVPPLRERASDIQLLIAHFTQKLAQDQHLTPRVFSAPALKALEIYSWPGNVRELRNLVERCLILTPGPRVEEEDLAQLVPALGGETKNLLNAAAPLAERLQATERQMILEVCESHRWHLTRAAEALGLERSHLYKKMKALDISRPEES